MMDGILPEHNETEDPSTWSPISESEEELADIEAVADRLVVGNSDGQIFFVPLGALAVSESLEVESSNDAALRASLSFKALFHFLCSHIYCVGPALLEGVAASTEKEFLLGFDDISLNGFCYSAFANHLLYAALFFKMFLSVSVLDLALEVAIKQLLFPAKNPWSDENGGLMINDMGFLCWIDSAVSDLGSNSFGLSGCSDSAEDSASSGSHALSSRKPRGRPRKADTPKIVNLVKRSTRNNLNGYVPLSLPDGPSQRKKSTVKKARVPEVMQIEEMQRLGVEHCNIAPEELTEERLSRNNAV
jgi:hypothetical protein